MKEETVLKELFALSDKEAITYIRLLELGQATTRRLSEVTHITRTTIYDVLSNLIKKGLAGQTRIEGVRYYYAVEPEKLLQFIKEKEREFISILPSLKSKMGIIGKRPEIKLFEGKKGIDAVNEDVLKSKEILAYGSFKILNEMLRWQVIDFIKKRIKLGIKWRGITDSSIKKQYFYKDPKYQKLTKLKIDDSLKDMETWNYIYNNKIAILSFKKENFVGIIIEDEAVSNSYRIIFERLWNQARNH
jgi:sugar-specific transcriptional regulator TrmB